MEWKPRSGLQYRAINVGVTNRRLIQVRWGIGGLILAGTLVLSRFFNLPLPLTPLLLLGSIILIYNIFFYVISCRTEDCETKIDQIQRLIILQVLLDWVSMAFFLHFTGGITSPAIPIFLIHLLVITILLPDSSPLLYLGLVIGVVVIIAALEGWGIWAHYTIMPALAGNIHQNPIYVLGQIVFFSTAAGVMVMLASAIMKRLRIHERQLEGLLITSQTVSSTLKLSEVLEHLVVSAAQALSVRSASIRLLDATGENLRMEAATGLSDSYRSKGPVQVSRSLIDREALGGRTALIHNAASDNRFQYRDQVLAEGIKSVLVAPISGRKGVLGVLRVYSHQEARFGEEEVDYVQAIAAQGGIAIENAMAHASLQEEEQARNTFIRTVTHELRAPVAGAQSLVRILDAGLAGPIGEKQQSILQRVSRRLDFLQELINDLLTLASSSSHFQIQPEPTALLPVLRLVLEDFRPLASEKGIFLELDGIEPEWMVWAGEDTLKTIFTNLVGNAVKYTHEGGSVRLESSADQSSVSIRVSDTGIGIPENDLANLWKDFYRASNARSAGIQGTGLGLSIVKRLIENVDGRIRVQSKEGEGTAFTVTLRRVKNEG
ncbi:MAG: GAF domain-containing sensor histidine kinase [Anaerolineales bacterium]|nr:GAF domain-containing sensor histidine kinase [Anaerolineales bacterium]